MPVDLLASWTGLAGDSAPARDVWADLMARWSEPHRRYHGPAHLLAVLTTLDEHIVEAEDPAAVRAAAWFHDAVYDPRDADNESRSAEVAAAALTGLGWSPERVAEVRRLVLVTATHRYAADDRAAATLCDADLAVLAGPAAAYVAYANAVREEYAHVPDDAFRTGRAAVLQSLLDRPRLFGLRTELEEPARRNVAAELTLLTG